MATVLIVGRPCKGKIMKAMAEMIINLQEDNLARVCETEGDFADVIKVHSGFTNIIMMEDTAETLDGKMFSSDTIVGYPIEGPFDQDIPRTGMVEWMVLICTHDNEDSDRFIPFIEQNVTSPIRGRWFTDENGWWNRYKNDMLGYMAWLIDHPRIYTESVNIIPNGITLGLMNLINEDNRQYELYYFNPDTGYLQTGWVKIRDDWFYFCPKAAEGLMKLEDGYHYFARGKGRQSLIIDGEYTVLDDEKGTLPAGEYTTLEDGMVHKIS